MDRQAGLKAVLKGSIGHPLLPANPLGTKGLDRQTGLKVVLKESTGHPLLSASPLGTKGLDRQTGLKAVLKESIGHPLLSISLLQKRESEIPFGQSMAILDNPPNTYHKILVNTNP